MSAFEKHKNEYFKNMINAWLVLSKKHNQKIKKVNKDIFYWSSFVDVELEFTNKGELLNYKFIEKEVF